MKTINKFTFVIIVLISAIITSCTNVKTDDLPDGASVSTVKDIDGNVYRTIKIGTQTWMVENLKTTKYNNGNPITNLTDASSWKTTSTGAWCNYENDIQTGDKYGKLYNWYAISTGYLAPKGWHIPTDAEWTTLENFLIISGYNYDGTTSGNKIAKSLAAKTDWATSTGIGVIGNDLSKNNSSGFTALPGGWRDSKSDFGFLRDDPVSGIILNSGYWWCSSNSGSTDVIARRLIYSDIVVNMYNTYSYPESKSLRKEIYLSKLFGLSVRCVKD